MSSHADDFNTCNKVLTAKLLRQGYRFQTFRKAFSKFYRRHFVLVSKYYVGLKTLLLQGLSEPEFYGDLMYKSRKENTQKLTQLSSRFHPRHLVGKGTAQKDTIIDVTSDSQMNSNFPYRWSPASLTFNNYFYLFLYLYIT